MTDAGTLYLHIGLAKTGTSFLQSVLAGNRPALRQAGFIYPFVRREGMFHAAVEMRGQYARWGLSGDLVRGTWAEMLRKAREFPGSAVISHEIWSGAEPAEIERALEPLRDFDLHVVVTARDLARILPAHWQEAVKNGQFLSFSELVQGVLRDPEAEYTRFWPSQDLGAILAKWAPHVPAPNVHVVLNPPPGADRGELWRRFASAIGLPPGTVDAQVERGMNESVGAREVHLLRQLNLELSGAIPQPNYARVVKRLFSQQLLVALDSEPARCPEELREPLTTIAEGWIRQIRDAGYSVHGELEDLLPRQFGTRHPDDYWEEVPEPTLKTFSALLQEIAELRFGPRGEAAPTGAPTGAPTDASTDASTDAPTDGPPAADAAPEPRARRWRPKLFPLR